MSRTTKVWDLPVRLFHWSLALLVLAAFLTADDDETVPLHARVGLAVAGLLVFRLLWGLVGSRPARFSSFVRSPRAVLAYARDVLRGRPPLHVSHNPLGAAMVIAMLATLALVALTGMLTYLGPLYDGPLPMSEALAEGLEEVHEALAAVLPWLIALHVAGVALSSLVERQNLVRGMIDGKKRVPAGEAPLSSSLARRTVAFLFALFVSGAVAGGLAWMLRASESRAAGPSHTLLDEYEREARAADPRFTTFDAARGEALYLAEHLQEGKPISCASCHTRSPTAKGRSPAGRVISPLAPSADGQRFTVRKKADKWFTRNCKQVLGRACTATEKGDVLVWLLTFDENNKESL